MSHGLGQDRSDTLFERPVWTLYGQRSWLGYRKTLLRDTNVEHFSPSPNGTYVAFTKHKASTGDHLGVFDVTENKATVFKSIAARWDWLDDDRIIFYDHSTKLSILDVATSNRLSY